MSLRLLWAPVNLLQGLAITLWTVLWISAALVVRLLARSPGPPLKMARTIWAPGILAIGGVSVAVEGLERVDLGRPCLFAMNHQSQVDIPVAFKALPVNLRFMVKEELRKVPFLGWYISAMGMVFVDRRDRLRSLQRMGRASLLMKGGAHFLSFPEGKRSRDGQVRPFKAGAFIPAIEAQVPVVPAAVVGAGAILPAGTLRLRPGRVKVVVGEPVPTEGLQVADRHRLSERVHEEVKRLYEGAGGRVGEA